MTFTMQKSKQLVFSIFGIAAIVSWHFFLADILLMPFQTEALLLLAFIVVYAGSALLYLLNSKGEKCDILYFIAVGTLPSVLLFHYVAQNIANFCLTNCLLLSIVLASVSIALYFLIAAKGDKRMAFLPLLLVWILFWGYPHVVKLYPNRTIFWILVIILFGISLYFAHSYHMDQLTGATLAGVICLLFIYNFGSALVCSAKGSRSNDSFQVKTAFSIDANAAHPDIFWLHMDGMMGFDAVESMLKDSQQNLKDNLASRGFRINNEASLDIGWTAYALPALTSPSIYDNNLSPLMDSLSEMTDYERKEKIENIDSIYSVYPKLELFSSFNQAGYHVYHILNDIGKSFERIPTKYDPENDFSFSKRGNIVDLLVRRSLFSCFESKLATVINRHNNLDQLDGDYNEHIFDYVSPTSNIKIYYVEHYDWYLSNLFENTLEYPSPKLVYLQNFLPHFPFKFNEDGLPQKANYDHDMTLYLPQHEYCAKMMLGMIDRILKTNENAIIIIQGDHGVHYFARGELAAQGFTDEQMLTMNYSTISAVRIPEKYGTLTEPLDPLDITRFLVNHFVGKGNYSYLYYHEEE